MSERPNIILFITDQQRGDCLGIEDHPVLQTPYLDEMASSGVRFRRGYAACPVCVPARRTLMTGRKPSNQGVMMNYQTHLEGPTLPGELTKAGYQTHLVGKLHLHPERKLYGFMSADWADSPACRTDDDYHRFLIREGVPAHKAGLAHGCSVNGYVARPWPLDEQYHFTNWCADRAIDFLQRRDPTVPFFLKVSFHQPHQPMVPPRDYWDRYIDAELPEPYVGDWARIYDEPQRGMPVDAWRFRPTEPVMRQARAGYYGCIDHIDNQIGRILTQAPKRDTILVFVSDHGEMLGDHQWFRKRNAFEPSARVPYLIKLPPSMGPESGQVRDEVVELMDLMPTLLDAAGVDVPASCDGRSLLPLIRGESDDWREYLHGECAAVPTINSGMQYVTDGRRKYIYYPGTGDEHFFDLEADPREMHNLTDEPGRAGELEQWRGRLIRELEGRPEGFVKDGRLQVLSGNSPFCMPGYEN